MGAGGRGKRSIDRLSPELRAEIIDRIDMGCSAAEIMAALPEIKEVFSPNARGYSRTFEEYVKNRRDQQRVVRVRRAVRVSSKVLDVLGVNRETLTHDDRLALGRLFEVIAAGGKESTIVKALQLKLKYLPTKAEEAKPQTPTEAKPTVAEFVKQIFREESA